MHSLPRSQSEIHLPLFDWANRHRAKPFPKITSWQIDRNLRVSHIEVRT
jgi:hypothetical protein